MVAADFGAFVMDKISRGQYMTALLRCFGCTGIGLLGTFFERNILEEAVLFIAG